MVSRYIHTWIVRLRQRLSKLEQYLVTVYTKGPKDPKRLALITEALRPELAKEVSMQVSPYLLHSFAPDIVTSIAVVSAIQFNANIGLNIQGFFYEVKSSKKLPASVQLVNNGHYINIPLHLQFLKEEITKLLDFYNDPTKTSAIDIQNKVYLEQNFDIFLLYIDSLVSAINQNTVYLHAS